MTAKSAVIVTLVSAFLFTAPALAIDSTTSGKTPSIIKRTETKVEKMDQVVASKEAKLTEKFEDIKTKIATRTAALKAKIAQFKDQKKAELTDRINTSLSNINTNRTAEMQKNLSKMTVILDKLESRINSGNPDIKDPVSAKAAVASARGVIASASAAIQKQAQKDYTITVTTESKVKTDVQKVRMQLSADLQTARNQVINAKQSVSNAIRIAKAGPQASLKPEKEGTASGRK